MKKLAAVLHELLVLVGLRKDDRRWPVHCRRCGKVTGADPERGVRIICRDCLTPTERAMRRFSEAQEDAIFRPHPKQTKTRGIQACINKGEE